MKAINHITQPFGMSCVSACIAMLTKMDVKTVYAEFHAKYHKHELTIVDYLESKGVVVQPERHMQAGSKLHAGFVYVVTVPALDQEGLFHQILLDLRWFEYENKIRVYDPAKGLPGARYYTHNVQNKDPDAFYLRSWIIDGVVVKAPELEINVYDR